LEASVPATRVPVLAMNPRLEIIAIPLVT
jgi:hypothetical protein